MTRILHSERAFADRLNLHMLKRNVPIEEDLVDQLFNSTEKRLARGLAIHTGIEKRNPALVC